MAVMILKAPVILNFHVVLFIYLFFMNGYIKRKSTSAASTTKFLEIPTIPKQFKQYFVISFTITFKQHIGIRHFVFSR